MNKLNHKMYQSLCYCLYDYAQYVGRLAQLRRETKLFRASARWFYPGSIPGQGKIMNVQVFYHEVNMVLWALFSNV